jgi:amino acid adenylation domain-containing protein
MDSRQHAPGPGTPKALVHEQVEHQAAARPGAVAVTDGRHALTYPELNERAGRLARYLRSAGVGPDTPVGVCLRRSPDLVVALLGVLKAGGAYVPLDPDYPVDRLRYMLADAAPPVLITDSCAIPDESVRAAAGPRLRIMQVDDEPDDLPDGPSPSPDARCLAYIIYTSGSTGVPKGVMIPHAGLSGLVRWHLSRYQVGPGDHTSQIAATSFDASVWEIWPPLVAGATLHLAREEDRLHPDRMLAWLSECGITMAFLPTPMAEEILRLPPPPGMALRTLLTGGDRLVLRPPPGTPYELVNHYGPTEASVVTTAATVHPHGSDTPSIGYPIDGRRVHLLDDELRPVAPGKVGEVYIGGPGLARGYIGHPAETAARFVPDPFGEGAGARLYRTGDLARCREDGKLQFVGRADDQVQVRGFRVELGEVEAQLRSHPQVRDAVVVLREPGGLVGYVTGTPDGPPSVGDLRRHLLQVLPPYMVPAWLVRLEAFPISPSGKIDRGALPAPGGGGQVARDPVEEVIATIWRRTLSLPSEYDLGVEDSFFGLGGHSILACQALSRVQKVFEAEVALGTMLADPTIAGIARTLRDCEETPGRIAAIARVHQRIERLSDEEVERELADYQAEGAHSAP